MKILRVKQTNGTLVDIPIGVNTAGAIVESHNINTSAHTDIREQISQLSSEKVDKNALTLGLHSDGKYYIFVNGTPVGTGLEFSSGDVFGYVDENNTVILNGSLADGTYSIKYEMEDENGEVTTIDIGNLVLDTNVYYSVTKNLTQCSISNNATQVVEGESYSATITANSGYELKSVAVTMGGSAVTVTNGVINIASVMGNIVITAVAEEAAATTYNITNNLSGCTTSNSATTAEAGNGYSATITAESGYKLSAVYVTMGGSRVAVSNNVINITSVTGDIIISCVGYAENTRQNSGGTTTASNHETTAFIPFKYGDTLCIKGVTTTNATTEIVRYFMEDQVAANAKGNAYANQIFGVVNGELKTAVDIATLFGDVSNIAYVRITANEINANSIITVNHPIV